MIKNIFIIFLVLLIIAAYYWNFITQASFSKDVEKTDVLLLQNYFHGSVKGKGIIQDWQKNVVRSFQVTMQGEFSNKKGIIKENFLFDDGEEQYREWHVSFKDNNHFEAQASDFKSVAQGKQINGQLNMKYVYPLNYNNKIYNLNVDDWMYAIDEKTIINKTAMKKFGLSVAYLTIIFTKE